MLLRLELIELGGAKTKAQFAKTKALDSPTKEEVEHAFETRLSHSLGPIRRPFPGQTMRIMRFLTLAE
ncbi:hypothetical protein ACLOJK_032002 [Asimina triloba]